MQPVQPACHPPGCKQDFKTCIISGVKDGNLQAITSVSKSQSRSKRNSPEVLDLTSDQGSPPPRAKARRHP